MTGNYEDAIPAEYLPRDAKPARHFRYGHEFWAVIMGSIISICGLIFVVTYAVSAAGDYSRADALANAAKCPPGEDAVFSERDCVSLTAFEIDFAVFRSRSGTDRLLLFVPGDARKSVDVSFLRDDAFDAAVGDPSLLDPPTAQRDVGLVEAWRGDIVAVTTGKNTARPGVTVQTTLHPDNQGGEDLAAALLSSSGVTFGGILVLSALVSFRGSLKAGKLPYVIAGVSSACAVTFSGGLTLVFQPGNVFEVGSATGAGWVTLTAGICWLLRRRLDPHRPAR